MTETAQKKSWWQRQQERADRVGAKFEGVADRIDPGPSSEAPPVQQVGEVKARGAKFEGAKLSAAGVSYKGTTVPLPATARVETAGDVRRRATLSRTVMTGGVGFFFLKKKVDDRELYLTVEGEGESFVMDVNPKKGRDAREFAARVNAAR